MTPSPSPSPIVAALQNIDWSSLFVDMSNIFASGKVGIIASGVLTLLLMGVVYYFNDKLNQAQIAAAAAATAAANAAIHAYAPSQSSIQEGNMAGSQSTLSAEEQADLLKFLQSLSDTILVDAATKAYGAAQVQSSLGTSTSPLSDSQRQSLYHLYGVV